METRRLADSDSGHLTDAEAIASVIDGDIECFEVLVCRYYRGLLRTAVLRLGDQQAAEDAVQECLLAAFRGLATYDSQYSFRTWLWAILRNECRRKYRDIKREGSRSQQFENTQVEPQTGSSIDPLESFEQYEEVNELIGRLPEKQAEAVRLRFAGELKYNEMAQLMGCSLATAKNRVRKGGIGNGAQLGLVLAVVLLRDVGEAEVIVASFLGALLSAGVIALMGFATSSGGLDRDRLVVGGTILAKLEGSVILGILFMNQMHNVLLGWTLGRLVHVDWIQVQWLLPALVFGLVVSVSLVHSLDAVLLGDQTAASLGVRVGILQSASVLTVVVLSGVSVAAAGPIPFVGLVVPNLITRARVPAPQLRLFYCAAGGALLAGFADVLSKLSSDRGLVPLGIWTMAMGSLFFLLLSTSKKR